MSDALQALVGLSAGTVSTLMRERGMPDSDKYDAISVFHARIVSAALDIDSDQYERDWCSLYRDALKTMDTYIKV